MDNSNSNSNPTAQLAVQQAGQTTFAPNVQNNDQPLVGPASARGQQNASGKQLVYQLNDLINFTCIAGPSHPGARLAWLLNDEPIVAAAGANKTWSGKALAWDLKEEFQPLASGLVESRSTFSFRLQANHLKVLRKQAPDSGRPNQMAHSSSILPVKVSCLSRFSVEFGSETSVLVSNGKAAKMSPIRRRTGSTNGEPPTNEGDSSGAAPPIGASLSEASERADEPPGPGSRRRTSDAEDGAGVAAAAAAGQQTFRWPPTSEPADKQQRSRVPSSLGSEGTFADAWVTPSQDHSGAGDQVASASRRQPTRARPNVVWTQRQLRAQAEHIGQLIRKSRPNELETPLIEARSMRRRDRGQSGASSPAPPTATSRDGGRDQDGLVEQDDEERAASPPSILISSNQFELMDEVAPAVGGPDRRQSRGPSRDHYELEELVNFTCRSVMASDDIGIPSSRRHNSANPLHAVQVKWFINDREVSSRASTRSLARPMD